MGRPLPVWHGFVGQQEIVASLREHAQGALQKNEALPHIAFGGPSGVGKTHLARAIATEMGTKCLEFYASRQSRKGQLAAQLATIKKADVLFIDEVHALPIDCQELMFPAIDRYEVPAVDQERATVRENDWVKIDPFTLVIATDQPGMLRKALKQRIVLRYSLGEYTLPEMRQIVFNYAAELKVLLKPQAATRLAEAARGLPRRARHLLNAMRITLSDTNVEINKGIVDRYLKSIGIDEDNLTKSDRQYLRILCERKSHVSITTMAIQLGTDTVAVQTDIEGYLIRLGLVAVESAGRILTATGKKYCAERGLS